MLRHWCFRQMKNQCLWAFGAMHASSTTCISWSLCQLIFSNLHLPGPSPIRQSDLPSLTLSGPRKRKDRKGRWRRTTVTSVTSVMSENHAAFSPTMHRCRKRTTSAANAARERKVQGQGACRGNKFIQIHTHSVCCSMSPHPTDSNDSSRTWASW